MDEVLDYFESRCGSRAVGPGGGGSYVQTVGDRFELYYDNQGQRISAGYSIEHNRIRSEETLLAWILQLSDKTWVTPAHIKDLILAWQAMTGKAINRTV